MDKQQLLNEIEEKELQRVNDLSDSALRAEVSEWFTDDCGEDIATADRNTLIIDYMEDYMRWNNDKSVNELLEMVD